MRKSIIILLLSFLLITTRKSNFNKDNEITIFLSENNLTIEDVKPYLQFSNFQIENYFEIDSLRREYNYSYTKAVNKYKYQNKIAPAIFSDSYLILVNKQFYVEKGYEPKNLVDPREYGVNVANDDILVPREVLLAFIDMITTLKLHNLYLFSGFRTYTKQEALYNYYQDDNYSARPGHSEHHTGLALDISTLDTGLTNFFATTPEYNILIKNSYKFGFILRYPLNKENETGYLYEPWHFRYVGKEHAEFIMKNRITLEHYLFENYEI